VRWLVDECIDAGLVSHLRAGGHEVVYLAEIAPAASDTEVIVRARAEGRIVLTEDKDFGDLVFRRGHDVPCVVLLRIDPARHERKRIRLEICNQSIWRELVWSLYNCRRSKVSLASPATLTNALRLAIIKVGKGSMPGREGDAECLVGTSRSVRRGM
jgi:predicted nuclease of predicted toxin-antitoxin system